MVGVAGETVSLAPLGKGEIVIRLELGTRSCAVILSAGDKELTTKVRQVAAPSLVVWSISKG